MKTELKIVPFKPLPLAKPIAIQRAKPQYFLSAETKSKLICIHIWNTTNLRTITND